MEAEPYAMEALRLGTEEFGVDHPTTASLLNNLALLYHTRAAAKALQAASGARLSTVAAETAAAKGVGVAAGDLVTSPGAPR